MGKALYRKYRPISLETVVGQDSVVKPLSEAIKNGNLSHAYIFTGPRGCGKTSVARIFAHEVNGFKYELEDSYVDIIEIDGASNRGIDNIRDLREKATIAPTEGKYKVYIIDEFHMLTRESFNALLKLMEEPPEHVIFLLATTNLEKVPVTILSRAQVYNFNLADKDVMMHHLRKISDQEGIKISDDALKIIVRRGGGSFRDSISLLDQISNLKSSDDEIEAADVDSALGLPEDEKIKNLLSGFENGEKVTNILKDLLNSGKSAEVIAGDIIERIVENPTGKTLALIDKLFNVAAPFADAKLLVAFLEAEKYQAAPQVVIATTTTETVASVHMDTEKKAAFMKRIEKAKVSMKKRAEDEHREKPQTYEASSLDNSVIQGDTLNLEAFVRDIKDIHRGIGNALERSRFILNDKELKVYPNKSYVGVLEKPNNLKLLKSAAPGYFINIINTAEEKTPDEAISVIKEDTNKPKPSKQMQEKIDKISDIMEGSELKEDEDAPF